MPRGSKILGQPIDEEKWSRAKERAAEEGHENDWDYVMDIYKKMSHLGEFKQAHITERKKKGQKLPEWREKRWDSKKKQLKEPVKKSMQQVRLVMYHGDLDEFRCGHCGALLLKGLHLEKAMLEIKCRKCGSMVVNIK